MLLPLWGKGNVERAGATMYVRATIIAPLLSCVCLHHSPTHPLIHACTHFFKKK